jgi:AdoMet dependent proline di-methyltransferase
MSAVGGNDGNQKMVPFIEIERMLIECVGEISGVDMDGHEYKGIEHLWDVELSNTELPRRSPDSDDSEDDNNDDIVQMKVRSSNKQSTNDKPLTADTEKGRRWYNTAYDFWENEKNCPTTDDGVLGGYGKITPEDVKGSHSFLDQLSIIRPTLRFDHAADCGAGIGRVTKHLLLHRFQHVDIIEQSPRLLAAAPEYIGEMSSRATCIVQKLQVSPLKIEQITRDLLFLHV